jgi:hypothetical protein
MSAGCWRSASPIRLAATDAHYRAVLDARDAQLGAIEADLASW